MNRATAIDAADAISTYILAKDGNRPQLMKLAFVDDCELEMAVRTDAISFPSSAKGLEQITQVLVTGFGDQYENVRRFAFRVPVQVTCRISVAIGWSGCRRGRAGPFAWAADTMAGNLRPTMMGA
jgi:hypothetical protein